MKKYPLFLIMSLLAFTACQSKEEPVFKNFPAGDAHLRYSGRTDLSDPAQPVLIGSASSVEMAFSGDSVQLLLRKLNPAGEHNYVSLELDGEYLRRIRLEKDTVESFTVQAPAASDSGKHILKIYKATEASNGNVAFLGLKGYELSALPAAPKRTIEFVGNSITCGMGVDYQEIPCDSGVWYDQHNAYLAYGPRAARTLNAAYMVSCVSGIGVYRNWNSGEGEAPVMPDVYGNRYLNTDNSKPWDFSSFSPDLVSIALGTNDFSEGDGTKERQPFDSIRYISKYIEFINTVYSKYPDTQITLLTSPMVSGEKGATYVNSLKAVKEHFRKKAPDKKPIAIYNFESITPHGCGYHPDKDDQRQMAEALIPFYKEIMGW